ncbi:hypothetical protein pb186bvf_002067 [Paramecium bursaria]
MWGLLISIYGIIRVVLYFKTEQQYQENLILEKLMKQMELGRLYFQAGKYQESINAIDDIFRLDKIIPQDANIVLINLKGMSLLYLEKYDEAIENINKALDQEPNNVQSLFVKAQILYSLGRHMDAINIYEKVLEQNPDNFDSFVAKAKSYSKLGYYNEAQLIFETFFYKYKPIFYVEDIEFSNDIEKKDNEGYIFIKIQDLKDIINQQDSNEALYRFKLASQLNSSNGPAFYNQGTTILLIIQESVIIIQNNFKRLFIVVIRLYSTILNHMRYMSQRTEGSSLFFLNQFQMAIEIYEMAILQIDESQQKELSEHKVKQLDDLKYQFKQNILICYYAALNTVNRLIDKDQNNINYLDDKVTLLSHINQYEELITVTNQILEIDSNNTKALASKGIIQIISKDNPFLISKDSMKQLINLIRFYLSIRIVVLYFLKAIFYVQFFQGRILYEQKKFEESLENFDRSFELDQNKESIIFRALIHQQLKSYDQALELLDMAINFKFNENIVYLYKGSILYYQKKYVESIQMFEQSYIIDPKMYLSYKGKILSMLELQQYEQAVIFYQQISTILPSSTSNELKQVIDKKLKQTSFEINLNLFYTILLFIAFGNQMIIIFKLHKHIMHQSILLIINLTNQSRIRIIKKILEI